MVVLILLMLGAMGLAVLITAGLMARAMLRPPRMTDGKASYLLQRVTPLDIGIPYEDVRFDVSDGRSRLRIAGWWMPHSTPSDTCVVMIHGTADAKVGAIAWAPALRTAGVNLLAIDLPAHGESGGKHFTGGWHEHRGVQRVLGDFRDRYPQQAKRFVLFGISAGALIATAAAQERDDVAGVILESPIERFTTGLSVQTRLANLPGGIVQKLAVRIAEIVSGSKLGELSTSKAISNLKSQILVISGNDDVFLPEPDRQALEAAVTARGGTWHRIAGADHLLAYSVDPQQYERVIFQFFQQLRIETAKPQA